MKPQKFTVPGNSSSDFVLDLYVAPQNVVYDIRHVDATVTTVVQIEVFGLLGLSEDYTVLAEPFENDTSAATPPATNIRLNNVADTVPNVAGIGQSIVAQYPNFAMTGFRFTNTAADDIEVTINESGITT